MKPFYDAIGNMLELIPILGGKKFMIYLKECNLLFDQVDGEEAGSDDEKDEHDHDSEEEEHSSQESSEDDEEKILAQLEHLNNDIMIKLMTRIVILIEYFCR